MTGFRIISGLIAIALFAVLCVAPQRIGAQGSGSIQMEIDREHKLVTRLDVENGDAAELLRRFFKETDQEGTVSPDLKARVTLNLRNHTYTSVLAEILHQAKATSDLQAGIIVVRQMTEDELTMPSGRIDLDLKDVEVHDALRQMFKRFDVSWSLAPEVKGNVTVNLRDADFTSALWAITTQADATWRREGGVYMIITRESAVDPVRLSLNARGRSFESAMKVLASNMRGTIRFADNKCYLLDAQGAIFAVIQDSKVRR